MRWADLVTAASYSSPLSSRSSVTPAAPSLHHPEVTFCLYSAGTVISSSSRTSDARAPEYYASMYPAAPSFCHLDFSFCPHSAGTIISSSRTGAPCPPAMPACLSTLPPCLHWLLVSHGVKVLQLSVMRPELIMKSIIHVITAGILAIYGLVAAVLIANSPTFAITLYKSFLQLGAGLSAGVSGLAAGFAIGIVGDAGVML